MPFSRKKKEDFRPLTVDEVLVKLENYCAYRERCPKEVSDKIKELGLRGTDAEQVYAVLEADGFFKEARFAAAFANGKLRFNHWGKVRIRQELVMRGIDPGIIREALDSISETEYFDIIGKMIEKKARQYDGDGNAREKTVASIARAGFETSLIFRLLDEREKP
jgi:regulatory protein